MDSAKIPIIDIAAEGIDEATIASDLVDAACTFGFVYIKNTGRHITVEQLSSAWEISKTLFALPFEEKSPCSINKNRGWTAMHAETLDPKLQKVGDFKECFNFGDLKLDETDQPVPSSIAPLKPQIAEFRNACHDLCRRLMYLFGVGLQVDPPTYFSERHAAEKGDSGTILRMLYYPALPAESSNGVNDFRAGAHSDYGSMTLLFRLPGQAGLEILSPEFKWVPVPVVPPGTENDPAPPILINIGDLLSYWTNGLLRSTLHRVVISPPSQTGGVQTAGRGEARRIVPGESSREPRYSIAFFCHPAKDTALTPVPSDKVRSYVGGTEEEKRAAEANPYAMRSVVTAAEHLEMRLRDTYLEGFGGEKKTAVAL